MKVHGNQYRAIWLEGQVVCMIEQNLLPFEFKVYQAKTLDDTCFAISTMITRGAGSIGAAAAYGMYQAICGSDDKNLVENLISAKKKIDATRPTAVNLFYATERVLNAAKKSREFAIAEAFAVADECAEAGRLIGEYGNALIKDGFGIETHCNAGWLALVDYGSALAPIYAAHDAKKDIFVYVDETRPRNQGARLTAWELGAAGVKHAIIPDNAGAYYMSQGKINMVIVGADRIAANGDTANKIGTLEKAIAAKFYGIPFYVAAPIATIDMNTPSGKQICIEERSEDEVLLYTGPSKDGEMRQIRLANPSSHAKNPAFDVTPSELITGIITEKGIFKPNELKSLF
ncbi:MAG: S-methyl-5-thioribose-1-phosphate isomerase [Bacteroidales bacterium]|nr:S-methyl-5-thioribose-1-phosphate isomerase [Bacteroidales bacterium]